MIAEARLTAAEFAAQKLDLPEGGRWHELHNGVTVLLEAPDDLHGTIVMNLSRAIAQWLSVQVPRHAASVSAEIGLHVGSNPDTVLCPSLSLFLSGNPFEQSDRILAGQVPEIVVDVASSNDRRRDMRTRTLDYLRHGVSSIWVPDPLKKEIQVIRKGQQTLALGEWQFLEDPMLADFRVKVEEVFRQPDWWTSQGRNPKP